MKKLYALFLRLFGKKRFLDLDGDGQVEFLRDEISGVFAQFKDMSEDVLQNIEEYNKLVERQKLKEAEEQAELKRMIASQEQKLKRSQQIIEKAETEIALNKKLNERLQDFII